MCDCYAPHMTDNKIKALEDRVVDLERKMHEVYTWADIVTKHLNS